MTTLSLAFSLRLSSVTSTVAVDPAGITAPLEPTTASVTDALKRSPTLLVLVQTFEPEARLSVDPAGIPSMLPRGAVTSRRATAVGSGALALVDVGTPVFNFMSANS